MASDPGFLSIDPELLPVLEELRAREPVFHTSAFGRTIANFERMMSPDYWEVGASGRRYSRAFILRHLAENPPVDAAEAGWKCRDFGLRRLGPDLYLLTYTLLQGERITRRSTIWQQDAGEWRILYHQGTIAGNGGEDSMAN